MIQVIGFDYENDLEYLFNKQVNLISEAAKNAFELYEKNSKQEYKKNLWDIRNYYASFVQGNGAIKKASNDLMGEKIISVIISSGKNVSIPKLGSKKETIVFVLKETGVSIYKSNFKHYGGAASVVGAVDYFLIAPKRELKNVKTWSFSNEGFLSRLSYNSTEIKNGVSVRINLDGDELECEEIYQPLLHLFLYFAKNGGEENLSEKELQKIFLDKYILDMKNNSKIPIKNKEEKINVLYEKKGTVVKTKAIVDDGKKYDEYGLDKDGYNREGYNEYGFDREGYDRAGYNEKGFDRLGFDRDGYNKIGLDKNGYDKYGWNRKGINKETGTKYNEEGYDIDGYNKDGYDEEGYDIDGYNKDGYDKEWCDKEGYDYYGYDEEGYDRGGYDKYGYDKEGYNKEGYDIGGFNKNGFNKSGYNRAEQERIDNRKGRAIALLFVLIAFIPLIIMAIIG